MLNHEQRVRQFSVEERLTELFNQLSGDVAPSATVVEALALLVTKTLDTSFNSMTPELITILEDLRSCLSFSDVNKTHLSLHLRFVMAILGYAAKLHLVSRFGDDNKDVIQAVMKSTTLASIAENLAPLIRARLPDESQPIFDRELTPTVTLLRHRDSTRQAESEYFKRKGNT